MVSATQANHDRYGSPPADDPPPGVRGVARDLIELGELQAALFQLDADATTRRLTRTVVLAIVAGCIGLAAAPVALLALADWIESAAGWSLALSRAASAGIGLLAAVGMFAAARRSLHECRRGFDRSTNELRRNLDWLKQTLKKSP